MINVIQNPLEVIDELYRLRTQSHPSPDQQSQQSHQSYRLPASHGNYGHDFGEKALFERIICERLGTVDVIPLVTEDNYRTIPNHSLCRYRGLVQDVWNPEIFCCVSPAGLHKYRDETVTNEDNDDLFATDQGQLSERSRYLCIPIPGQSPWVSALDRNIPTLATTPLVAKPSSLKRLSSESIEDEELVVNPSSKIARRSEGGDDSLLVRNIPYSGSGDGGMIASEGVVGGNTGHSIGSNDYSKGTPACIALVYDEQQEHGDNHLKLNDVIEIIGIYSKPDHTLPIGVVSLADGSSLSPSLPHSAHALVSIAEQSDALIQSAEGGDDWDGEFGDSASSLIYNYPRVHTILIRRIGSSYPLYTSLSLTSSITNPYRYDNVDFHSPSYHLWIRDYMKIRTDTTNVMDPIVSRIVSRVENTAIVFAGTTTGNVVAVSDQESDMSQEAFSAAYRQVVTWIAEALGDDSRAKIAAEYVTLGILSRLYCRSSSMTDTELKATSATSLPDESSMVGSLTVQLVGFENKHDPRIQALFNVLKQIVPRFVEIQADNSSLTSGQSTLLPFRNYETDCIEKSPLQVSPGTVLVLNEVLSSTDHMIIEDVPDITATSSADVTSSAKALYSVVTQQKLPVRFQYFEVVIPMDSPVIVLSPASSPFAGILSGLCTDSGSAENQQDDEIDPLQSSGATVIRIRVSNLTDILSSQTQVDSLWQQKFRELSVDERIGDIRLWWATSRLRQGSMTPEVISLVETDFVRARQSFVTDPTSARTSNRVPFESGSDISRMPPVSRLVTAADLKRWICTARLLAIAEGCDTIESRHWTYMKALDDNRMTE